MSASQIGLVFSLSSVLGTFSPIIGGWLADRFYSRYRVFFVSVLGYAVVVALLPVSAGIRIGSTILAMVLMPCLQVFHPAGSTLIATCSINATYAHKGVDYSMLRIWMSLGYTVANFAFTPIMKYLGVNAPFYIALVFFGAIIFLRKTMQEFESVSIEGGAPADRHKLNYKGILKNYYIMTFVVINVIFAAAGNCSMYLSYLLADRAIDASQIGVVAAVKVCGEIVILLMLPRIKRVLSLSGLQLMAGAFLTAEMLLMQFAGNLLTVSLIAMLGGLGNGIALCTAGLYVRTMAPEGLEATAHSLWSMGSSLGGIILSFVFGRILDLYGVSANYWCAFGLECSWLVLFLGTLLFGRFVLKKKNAVPMLFVRGNEA